MSFLTRSLCKTTAATPPAFKGTPVAVFVGGTSGVGQGMVEAFGDHTKGNADIVIIGRNRAAAESILSQLPKPTDSCIKREFIQCDISRMKNVQAVTKELLASYPKINYLVLSAGVMNLNGRDETEEGIDTKLAAHYYSRWKFIHNLIPALNQANAKEEDSKVISVFSAGRGNGEIDLDDLGLKKTFTVGRAASHAATYNDLMTDEFALRHPDLTFIHSIPGLVRTNLLNSSTSPVLRAMGPAANVALFPFMISPRQCGENMWKAVYGRGKGAYQVSDTAADLKGFHGTPEMREKLWQHTVEATTVA